MERAGRLGRAFAWFWSAEAVSGFGAYVTIVAVQAVVVLTLGGGATETGLLSAARWLPYLVVGLVVGALVDRVRRRPVMVWTDLARGVLLLAIPGLWLADALTLPWLLAIMLAFGTASVVGDAASMAFLPRLVAPAALQRAHARIDGADAVAQVAGPALGGILARVLGAPLAVVVNALTFLYSAVVVALVRVDDPVPDRQERRHLLREIGEGVRFSYGASGLAWLAASTHVWFAGNAILGAVLAPFVLLTLGLGADQLGIVLSGAGVGAVVGAALTTRLGVRLGAGRTIIACHVLSAIAVLVMLSAMWAQDAWLATGVLAAGQGIHGLAMGASNSYEMSLRQLRTPDRLQGRVNITLRSANRSVIVLVAPLGGILADAAGAGPALGVAIGAFLASAALLAASPFRRVRAATDPAG